MKKYRVVSNETMEYWKIVEAKNERQAVKKADMYDKKNEWKADFSNCSILGREIEEIKDK